MEAGRIEREGREGGREEGRRIGGWEEEREGGRDRRRGLTWHWIGVGWVNSDLRMRVRRLSSKPK